MSGDTEDSTNVIIDNSERHNSTLQQSIRDLLKQDVFTDCHLEVEEKKIPCHRLILAACSPVLQAMLTSGMMESQTCVVPIKLFGTKIMESIVSYMYSGILRLQDDDMNEVTAASDFFQMTELKESLDEKLKNQVDTSNVFHWSKVADMYNLTQLRGQCDRIQLVKFKQVIEHKEFCELSREEVLMYCKKYKQYSGMCNDDLFCAVLKWIDNNKRFPELQKEIDFAKCSQSILEASVNHKALPRSIAKEIKKRSGTKQEKQQTLAYVTSEECVVADQNTQLRKLDAFVSSSDMYVRPYEHYQVCHTKDGFVYLKGRPTGNFSTMLATVVKYDAIDKVRKELPGEIVIRRGVDFSVVHNEKLYLINYDVEDQDTDNILVYDLKECVWSKLSPPEECRKHMKACQGAVVGDDLFFLDHRLHLFRVNKDKLERIPTPIECSKAKKEDSSLPVFSLTAVHRWLYIFAKEEGMKDVQVNCYDTALDIWTSIPASFQISVKKDYDILTVSSVMIENTIFVSVVTCYADEFVDSMLYEYSLLGDNAIRSILRPHLQYSDLHLSVVDVRKRLDSYVDAPVYHESTLYAEEEYEQSDSDYPYPGYLYGSEEEDRFGLGSEDDDDYEF